MLRAALYAGGRGECVLCAEGRGGVLYTAEVLNEVPYLLEVLKLNMLRGPQCGTSLCKPASAGLRALLVLCIPHIRI